MHAFTIREQRGNRVTQLCRDRGLMVIGPVGLSPGVPRVS